MVPACSGLVGEAIRVSGVVDATGFDIGQDFAEPAEVRMSRYGAGCRCGIT
jgi:hypothetical protein